MKLVELWESQGSWSLNVATFQGITDILRDGDFVELYSGLDLVSVVSLTKGQWISVIA